MSTETKRKLLHHFLFSLKFTKYSVQPQHRLVMVGFGVSFLSISFYVRRNIRIFGLTADIKDEILIARTIMVVAG